jgi:hypothetical protein
MMVWKLVSLALSVGCLPTQYHCCTQWQQYYQQLKSSRVMSQHQGLCSFPPIQFFPSFQIQIKHGSFLLDLQSDRGEEEDKLGQIPALALSSFTL